MLSRKFLVPWFASCEIVFLLVDRRRAWILVRFGSVVAATCLPYIVRRTGTKSSRTWARCSKGVHGKKINY